MATRIAWLLNLDAELELAAPRHYAPSPQLAERIDALIARLTVLTDDDCVLGRDAPPHDVDEVLAFCPTPTALARIAKAGLVAPEAPSLAVLQQVNSRSFCAALGQTLPRAQYVRDLAALQQLLAEPWPVQGWLLKRDFGFAGRERRRVLQLPFDASSLGFAQRSFARGEGLQVEPWCERTHDFALHGYVFRTGRVLLGEPVVQHNDSRGSWLDTRALLAGELDDGERAALHHAADAAGHALARAGYFGPFGSDGFRYLAPGGETSFQPRSEINARFSMGYPRGLLEAALSVPDYRRS
ncbi:MAG: hypothetical protein RLZZ450_5138 [Pseudomonadota bacterium]|jgi:hypothetical protein